MIVQDIISLIQIRSQHLAIAKNNDAIIHFINLGMEELYRRFNLSIKSETVLTVSDRALYELSNEDVQMLLSLNHRTGIEMKQSDVLDSMNYDYKIVNYRSFILRKPFDGYVYAIYKASPVMLRDINDKIKLPGTMIPALLTYVMYMSHDVINRDNKTESNNFYKMFELQCRELDLQGFTVPLNTESTAVQARGYV
jgi:hypothetical protein